MPNLPDISVNIPSEYLNALAEVIRTGLQRSTKLTPESRKAIAAWWDTEYNLIQDEIDSKKSKLLCLYLRKSLARSLSPSSKKIPKTKT